MKGITIKLTDATLRQLRNQARKTGRSVAALVRERVETAPDQARESVFALTSEPVLTEAVDFLREDGLDVDPLFQLIERDALRLEFDVSTHQPRIQRSEVFTVHRKISAFTGATTGR